MSQTLFLEEKNSNTFLVTFSTKEGDSKTGPLYLLWNLIKSYEVDILDVSLTRITNDYIQYIRDHRLSLEDRSSFTNMAARLLYYKSERNLPQQELKDEKNFFDRLPPELIEDLLEYKKIQLGLEQLDKIRSASQCSLDRKPEWYQYEENIDFLKMDLMSFLKVFQEYLKKNEYKRKTQFNIKQEEVILAELYKWLYDKLLELKRISFFSILGDCSLLKCIGYFLVILEMTKQNKIRISQDRQKDILLQLI